MTPIFSDGFAEVLKALDPEDWDNESVDELLAAADKNGDGELSVKEFLTLREHIAEVNSFKRETD